MSSTAMRDFYKDVKRFVIALVVVVMSWVLAAGASAAFTGCADPVKDPSAYQHQQEVKAEASYDADLMACTAKAKSLAESKICEDAVDVRWGVGPKGEPLPLYPDKDGGK